MPLVALALVLLLPLALVALMPLSLVLRYRASTARRQARGWVAAINVVAIGVSAALFLTVAAATSFWVPRAFTSALLGLAGGSALGLLGLVLSRWEATPGTLHYTPSRWLVLAIMLVVAARIVYGLWRAWHAWHAAVRGIVVAGGVWRGRLARRRGRRARLLPGVPRGRLAAVPPTPTDVGPHRTPDRPSSALDRGLQTGQRRVPLLGDQVQAAPRLFERLRARAPRGARGPDGCPGPGPRPPAPEGAWSPPGGSRPSPG